MKSELWEGPKEAHLIRDVGHPKPIHQGEHNSVECGKHLRFASGPHLGMIFAQGDISPEVADGFRSPSDCARRWQWLLDGPRQGSNWRSHTPLAGWFLPQKSPACFSCAVSPLGEAWFASAAGWAVPVRWLESVPLLQPARSLSGTCA